MPIGQPGIRNGRGHAAFTNGLPKLLPCGRPPSPTLTLSGGDLEFVVGEDEILFGLRLVAHEAAVEVGGGIWRLVGAEDLVLPLAIALALRILGAPSGSL